MPVGPIILLVIGIFIWTVFGRNQIRAVGNTLGKLRRWIFHQGEDKDYRGVLNIEKSDVDHA